MTTTNANLNTNGSTNGQPPLTSDDMEEVLLELNRFEKSPTQNIPELLERYMVYVAKTGSAAFPWTKLKALFRAKLENVIVDFSSVSPTENIPSVPNVDVFNFGAIRNKVFEQLDAFAGIPFTVQRLAELLTTPRRHYKRTDKFMRALEKNMLIVSTVEARANNNNENDSESRYFANYTLKCRRRKGSNQSFIRCLTQHVIRALSTFRLDSEMAEFLKSHNSVKVIQDFLGNLSNFWIDLPKY